MKLYGFNSDKPFDTDRAIQPEDPFCIKDISWMFAIPNGKEKNDSKKLDLYCVVLNSLDSKEPYTIVKSGGNLWMLRFAGNGWHISQNVKDDYMMYYSTDTFTLWNGSGTFPLADSTNSYYRDYHKNNT